MLPEKLLMFIKNKKADGYPDEMIKSQFLKMGWPQKVIDDCYLALSNQSASDQSIAAISTYPVSTEKVNTNVANTVTIDESSGKTVMDKPNRWMNSLMIMIMLISGRFGNIASGMFGMIYIMQSSMNKIGGEMSFLSEYPGTLGIAFVALVVSLYFFYIALKSRSFSQESWKWSVGSLIIVPFVFYPLVNLMILPIVRLSNSIENTGARFIFPGWDLAFYIVTLYILWKTKNLHTQLNTSMSKNLKIWLIVSITLTIVIATSFTYILLGNNGPKDLGYSVVSSQAEFTVHKISKLPSGYIYASDYSWFDEQTGEKSVRIALGSRISEIAKNISPIVIFQSKLTEGYDLKSDFATFNPEIETLALPQARNQEAYLGVKPLGNKTLYNLEFATVDGVKIKIVSPTEDPSTLIEIAQNID